MQDRLNQTITRAVTSALLLILAIDILIIFKYSSLNGLNADLVQNVLEVSSILHGNLLLHGWTLPSDNFYLSDNPFFLAGRLLFGQTLAAIYTATFLIYLTLLATSIAIVWSSAPNQQARAVGLGAIAFYLATPGLHYLAPVMLQGADHIAELGFCLLAWLTLARIENDPRQPRAGAVSLYLLFTFIPFLSDPLSATIFLIPTLAALLWTTLTSPYRPRQRLFLIALTLFSFVIARLALIAIRHAGGFQTQTDYSLQFVTAPDLALNIQGAAFDLIRLSGAYIFGASAEDPATIFALIRLAGLILVALATASALKRARSADRWSLNFTLALAICANILSSILSAWFTKALDPAIKVGDPSTRYLTPTILFGALLVALELPLILRRLTPPKLHRAAIALATAATLAITGQFFAKGAQRWHEKPVMARSTPMKVARWLQANGLTHGVGSYWESSLVTALSGEHVIVRAVTATNGTLGPLDYLSNLTWYDKANQPQFVLYAPGNVFGVNRRTIEATYGQPGAIESIYGFEVAILEPRTANK